MKKISLLFLCLFISSLCFTGCQEDEEPDIDPDLRSYVESFIFEANERDYVNVHGNPLSIDSLGITVTFSNINNPAVIGQCQRDPDSGQGLAIVIDALFWKASEELEKEYIMFHELGHCILNRNHTTASDINDTCLSIMEPGTGEICQSNYTESTRSELLDELFDF